MIITRAPLRIPLAGGGTDLPFYAEQRGGHVVSVAISRYVHAVVGRRMDADDYLVACDGMQRAGGVDGIRHAFVREALRHLGVSGGVAVHCLTEVEGGNGLGGSSSLLTALLCALHALGGEPAGPAVLAREATLLEREVLGEAGGVQDQYMAAYGGLREILNTTRADVIIRPLPLEPHVAKTLESNLLLFGTGLQRRSHTVVSSQLQQNGPAMVLRHYDRIKEVGRRARDSLLAGDLTTFGRTLHEHWTLKRGISDRMSSDRLDELYRLGQEHGAVGGKVIGAGGGGCLLFYVEQQPERFVTAMQHLGLRHLPFEFAWSGTELLVGSDPR